MAISVPIMLLSALLSERKKAEEALRRYEHIVASSSDMLALLDKRFVYLAANPAYVRALAQKPANVIGRTVAEVFGQEFFDAVIKPRAERCLAGEDIRYQDWFDFPGAGRRYMDVAYSRYVGSEKEVRGFVVTAHDITERKRTEEEIVRFSRVLERSLNEIFIFDAATLRFVNVNHGARENLGYSMEELRNLTPVDLKPEFTLESFAHLVEPMRAGDQEKIEFTTLHQRKDGTKYPVEVHLQLMTVGTPVFVAFILDITDRRRAEAKREELEAQLRQAHKLEAVGQMAGGVAHDFNNILTAILGNVELSMDSVRRELGPDHGVVQAMEHIEKAAHRASALTRQLLTFSRRDVMHPEVLNLNRILADLDNMLRRLITEDIALETLTDSALQSVRADAGQLEQVIINLVVNAADAMPDGGRLTLTTRNVTLDDDTTYKHAEAQSGPYVLLAVSDTGHGMDAATRERIFDPFFTTKAVGKGTGLGLATVHGIVKQSAGHIRVLSEPGHGSTFEVYFPAVEATPTDTTPASQPDASPRGQGTILLCEDDHPVCDLIAQTLESAGYTVVTANSGREGIDAAQAHNGPIDLLITDVMMPDMNGRVLSERLRATFPGLPILFISGYTANVIAHHGMLEEGVEFLEKPFTGQSLLTKVRAVLSKVRAKP